MSILSIEFACASFCALCSFMLERPHVACIFIYCMKLHQQNFASHHCGALSFFYFFYYFKHPPVHFVDHELTGTKKIKKASLTFCFHTRRTRGLSHRVHCVYIECAVQSFRIQGSFDLFAQIVMKCKLTRSTERC